MMAKVVVGAGTQGVAAAHRGDDVVDRLRTRRARCRYDRHDLQVRRDVEMLARRLDGDDSLRAVAAAEKARLVVIDAEHLERLAADVDRLVDGIGLAEELLRHLLVHDHHPIAGRRLARREVAAGIEVAASVDLLPVARVADDRHAGRARDRRTAFRCELFTCAGSRRTGRELFERRHVVERQRRISPVLAGILGSVARLERNREARETKNVVGPALSKSLATLSLMP